MTTELTLGLLTLTGNVENTHVHVTVRGGGTPGNRRLLGHLHCKAIEWSSLCTLVEVLSCADDRHNADRAEIQRLDLTLAKTRDELGRARGELAVLRSRLESTRRWAVAREADSDISREMKLLIANVIEKIMEPIEHG